MAATILMDDPDLETEIQPVPRDDEFYEVVNGERIGKPLMSAYAVKVGSRLSAKLAVFMDDKDLGEVVSEMLFRLAVEGGCEPATGDPTLAYVSFARWPADRPMPGSRETPGTWFPDLAVEVISPTNLSPGVDAESSGILPGWRPSLSGCRIPLERLDLRLRFTEANPRPDCW